ncbi:hypothetical protein [Klugiella xanthotipulae]|nr:hypothetical protein [Klugiella xanthotipulae]
MKHQLVLDKIPSRSLVYALDQDIARCTRTQLAVAKLEGRSLASTEGSVLGPVLTRWRCLIDAEEADINARNVGLVALAVQLHAHGFADSGITRRALAAIDELNDNVVLSDAFWRDSPAIKALLTSAPAAITRVPRVFQDFTAFRVGDAVSIRVGDLYYAAAVIDIEDDTDHPILHVYEGEFTEPPTAEQLEGRSEARPRGRGRCSVAGLALLPDPARQVSLIEGYRILWPIGEEPRDGEGRYASISLPELADFVVRVAGDRAPAPAHASANALVG